MRYLFTVIALLINVLMLNAQPLEVVSPESVGLSRTHFKYVDQAIEKEIAEGHIPGAVLAVVKDGAIPYIKAYGNKSITPRVESMSENTIFDMASCTKAMATAISAMILVERGQIALRDNIDFYIPDFNKNKSYNGRKYNVTIRHLMTHTSGIAAYVSVSKLESQFGKADIESLIKYVKSENINSVPGEKFVYSCLNFITLQYIIEKVTGQSLRDFAKENIFDPLGMDHTDYLPLGGQGVEAWANIEDIAPTEVVSQNSVTRGVVHDPLANLVNKGISGNSGIFSTASDVAILAAMILNDGTHNGTRIMSPLTVDAMCTIPDEVPDAGRSLGWDVSSAYSANMGELFGDEAFGHTGFTGSSITIDRENDMAVILLVNAIHLKSYESKYLVRLRALVANSVAASIMAEAEPIIEKTWLSEQQSRDPFDRTIFTIK